MNNCTLNSDFSGFKVNIFPLKTENFFKAQSSIAQKRKKAAFSLWQRADVIANMQHEFWGNRFVMSTLLCIDEQSF